MYLSPNPRLLRLGVVILALASCAHAQEPEQWLKCDVFWTSSVATVGFDFSLQVSFHDSPITETRIVLKGDGGVVVATAKTDSHGAARFRAIPEGRYHADFEDGPLFPSSNLELRVEAGLTPVEKVKVDWPDSSTAVRNLRGRFSVSDELSNPEIPLRNASVELFDLRTARLIESADTDANGDYEFATREPGLYVLRLSLPEEGETGSDYHDLAIELDPSAKDDAIPGMKAVQSDCGGLQLYRRSGIDDGWEQQ
jgi:hypothetical protein